MTTRVAFLRAVNVGKRKVKLVRLSFFLIVLCHYLEAKCLRVEALRHFVVGADDCRVMNAT